MHKTYKSSKNLKMSEDEKEINELTRENGDTTITMHSQMSRNEQLLHQNRMMDMVGQTPEDKKILELANKIKVKFEDFKN